MVLTKYVRAFEEDFPGTGLLYPKDKNADNGQSYETDDYADQLDTNDLSLSVGG